MDSNNFPLRDQWLAGAPTLSRSAGRQDQCGLVSAPPLSPGFCFLFVESSPMSHQPLFSSEAENICVDVDRPPHLVPALTSKVHGAEDLEPVDPEVS